MARGACDPRLRTRFGVVAVVRDRLERREDGVIFAVDYEPGEDNDEAYVRLCRETDYLKCHHECAVFFTFRDRFAEAIGVDPSTLYPAS